MSGKPAKCWRPYLDRLVAERSGRITNSYQMFGIFRGIPFTIHFRNNLAGVAGEQQVQKLTLHFRNNGTERKSDGRTD